MERKEALSKGMTIYSTGRPCKWGHTDRRYASSGICCECAATNQRKGIGKAKADIAAARAGLVRLEMVVHRDCYDALRGACVTMNALYGVHPAHNDPVLQKVMTGRASPSERAATLAKYDAYGRPIPETVDPPLF